MSVFTALLNNTFSLSRIVRTFDGAGGWVEARTTIGTVRGRLRPMGGTERDVADQEQREITHVLYVAAGANIARGDEVEGAGVIVEVLGVREPSRAGHHLEVDCREVQRAVTAEDGS